MKKISIVLLSAILLIGCSSNDYKQNSIPMSELNNIPDRVILNIEPQYQTTNYTCATVSLGMAINYVTNNQIDLSEEEVWVTTRTTIEAARKYGNDMNGLARVCKKYSVKYKFLNKMNIDVLQYYLAHDNPVILNIRPDITQNYTHALLAVGYDKNTQTIYINDPSDVFTEFSYEELNKRWNAWLYRPRFHSEQSGFILMKE